MALGDYTWVLKLLHLGKILSFSPELGQGVTACQWQTL
jgi:hypothetical protein